MSAEKLAYSTIPDFNTSRQASLFRTVKQAQFTGELQLKDTKSREWLLYIYMGRIVYATGGLHPVRRWRRKVVEYLQEVSYDPTLLQKDIAKVPQGTLRNCWEYGLLCLWAEQERVAVEQVSKMVRAIVTEIIFDLTQVREISFRLQPTKSFPTQIVLLDPEQVIAEAWRTWQGWQAAQLADRSPDTAPIIRESEELQKRTSANTYNAMASLLDGKRSLRDIAAQKKQEVLQITRLLSPYIQLGLIELVEIPDIPAPVGDFKVTNSNIPLIACVDDSLMICQKMQQVITGAGYQYIGISDELRALAIILSRKPDLIFLDLLMKETNGYDLCAQLRKVAAFKDTPIIILTAHANILDHLRAKVVGCTDFLSKPVEVPGVLGMLDKYLQKPALNA